MGYTGRDPCAPCSPCAFAGCSDPMTIECSDPFLKVAIIDIAGCETYSPYEGDLDPPGCTYTSLSGSDVSTNVKAAYEADAWSAHPGYMYVGWHVPSESEGTGATISVTFCGVTKTIDITADAPDIHDALQIIIYVYPNGNFIVAPIE